MNNWKEDTALFKAKSDSRTLCKCGHSMTISERNRICRWCGRKVYTPKEHFTMMLKRALERKNNYEM